MKKILIELSDGTYRWFKEISESMGIPIEKAVSEVVEHEQSTHRLAVKLLMREMKEGE